MQINRQICRMQYKKSQIPALSKYTRWSFLSNRIWQVFMGYLPVSSCALSVPSHSPIRTSLPKMQFMHTWIEAQENRRDADSMRQTFSGTHARRLSGLVDCLADALPDGGVTPRCMPPHRLVDDTTSGPLRTQGLIAARRAPRALAYSSQHRAQV